MSKTINYRIQNLRGIAFLLIFVSHCALIYDSNGLNIANWFGAFGVEIFIVLGGFLAFKYYKKDIRLFHYYKRKIQRFIPLHYITLVMAIPFCIPFTWKEIIKIGVNAILLQAWIPKGSVYFGMNAVSWYLSITVFFVFVTPVLVNFAKKMSPKSILLYYGIAQTLEIAVVYLGSKLTIDPHWITYICPINRTLDFFGGGLLYNMISINLRIQIKSNQLCYIGAMGALVSMVLSLFVHNEFFSVSIWFIPSLLIVCGVCGSIDNKKTVFSWLGDISFELFLLHQLIIRYVDIIANKLQFTNRIILFLISLIMSISVAYLYRMISSLFLRGKFYE